MTGRRIGSLFARVPDWAILVVFCLLFGLQVALSVGQKSATFDEPVNLAAGYVDLTTGDYRLNPQNLPFVKRLAALPLLFLDVRMPEPPHPWSDTSRYLFAHRFLYESNDADTLLMWARLGVLPLSLLLGCLVFLWAKQLFGRPAGLLALFLYTFEPNILAHSGLVTTDLAVACLMFVTIYGLYQMAQRISLLRLFLPALSFGLALLTKFTVVSFVPIVLLLGAVLSLSSRPLDLGIVGLFRAKVTGRGRKLLVLLLASLFAGLVAYGLIWAAYRFRYEGIATEGLAYPRPWSEILATQPYAQHGLNWAREAKVLPEPYLYGFAYLARKSGTIAAFLNGEIRPGGWWHYFLVTFLIKTPVPLLLFLGLALLMPRKLWRSDPVRTAFLFVPVLVYFGIASAMKWHIGHRHLLAIYPFLFIMVSALVPWAARQRAAVKGALAVLGAWYLVASVTIFPHYLAYFNELIGGPGNGYRYVVDSNLDWGQDLKGLKRYMVEQGIDRVWLSYFGTASPAYHGIAYNYLPSYVIFNRSRDNVPTPFVAISATNLQEVYLQAGLRLKPGLFMEFRNRHPVAKIGYSIFVYRVE